MTPWFTMPTGSEARRRAVLDHLQQLVAAARCTVQLARQEDVRVEHRKLIELLDGQLADLEALLGCLADGY